MKKAKLILLASIIFTITFCSKNQRVVNQLDGSWKVTSEVENGIAMPDSTYKDVTYKFDKCKVKKGACNGTVSEGGKAIPFTYEITEKGKKIVTTTYGITETSEILEHSKKKFKWKTTDGSDVTEITIEKN